MVQAQRWLKFSGYKIPAMVKPGRGVKLAQRWPSLATRRPRRAPPQPRPVPAPRPHPVAQRVLPLLGVLLASAATAAATGAAAAAALRVERCGVRSAPVMLVTTVSMLMPMPMAVAVPAAETTAMAMTEPELGRTTLPCCSHEYCTFRPGAWYGLATAASAAALH